MSEVVVASHAFHPLEALDAGPDDVFVNLIEIDRLAAQVDLFPRTA
jgi:hypothetical protein